MPFVSAEPTSAPRTAPPPAPARDKRAASSGFSSMVDDGAAQTEAARAQSDNAPRTADPARASDAQGASTPRDADAKASDKAARAAGALAQRKPDQPTGAAEQSPGDDPKPTELTNQKDALPADAQVALSPAALASDPSATAVAPPALPDQPAVAAAPVTPAPVAVAMPLVVPMPAPQQAPPAASPVAQAPAPLAMAAAGLAAAKAVASKSSEATGASVTAEAAADAAKAGDAIPKSEEAAAPKPAGTKPAMAEIQLPTGLGKPDMAADTAVKGEASQALQPAAPAQTETKIETKADTKPDQPTIDPKTATAAQTDTGKPVGPAKSAEPQAAQAPATDAGTAMPQTPSSQPAHHAVTHASPTVQLTAAIATAQPVPLNGLAVELAARATTGATRFEIRLDPAELGRIDVRIDIDKHGQVTSHLTVEKPETLAMLRQDSPQLQRALSDAGFKTTDGAMQFSLGDQSQSQTQQQQADSGQRHAHRLFIQDDDIAAPSAPLRDYGRRAAARSGVDISV